MVNFGRRLATALLSAAATVSIPASAATFMFDVSVTSREGGGGGAFQPFTFRQSWAIDLPAGSGPISTTASGSGLFATVTQEGVLSTWATSTVSPVSKELIGLAGPFNSFNSTILAGETFRDYLGFGFTSSDYDLQLGSLGQFYSDDGTNLVSTEYLMTLTVQEGGAQEAAFKALNAFNAAGLAQIFAAGPLSFSESGERQTGTVRAGFTSDERISYSGTATFRSYVADEPQAPVPEAATWAMMIAGFGAVGFAMRRRPPVRAHVTFP